MKAIVSRFSKIEAVPLVVLIAALLAAQPLAAQQTDIAARHATPVAWLQLRGGTDNTGVVPGTLHVSWAYKAPLPVRGVSVADGLVVIGMESADAAERHFRPDQRGAVAALDVATGVELWTHRVPNWVHGDPAIAEGRVFVTYGRYPMRSAGGITAYDLRSGRELWTRPMANGVMPAPVVDTAADIVVVSGGDHMVHVLDVRDGRELHTSDIGAGNAMASPRMDSDGDVYVGADTKVMRLDMPTGALLWAYDSPDLVELGTPPPAVRDSIVYSEGTKHRTVWSAFRDLPISRFASRFRKGYDDNDRRLSTMGYWFQEQWLLAFHRATGRLLWKQPLGVGNIVLRNNSGVPVVVGDRVVISSPVAQTLSAFDANTGKPLWRQSLPTRHVGASTITGDDILLGDKKGEISVRRLRDGELIGRCKAGASFSPTAPVIVGETLFTATRDGMLRATPWRAVRERAVANAGASCF